MCTIVGVLILMVGDMIMFSGHPKSIQAQKTRMDQQNHEPPNAQTMKNLDRSSSSSGDDKSPELQKLAENNDS